MNMAQRFNIMDKPNPRKTHKIAIPYLWRSRYLFCISGRLHFNHTHQQRDVGILVGAPF
jgi:hypothetical protein